MLQQTQVRTVLPYYRRFVGRFPDIRSLASAPESEVLEHWAGMGYYERARNIRRAALMIMDMHSGDFPQTYEQVVSLPGIGPYTAGAILSIAFNQPFPAVDGNVRRLIRRLHGIRKQPGERLVREIAAAWIPEGRAADFNQAVMELGALICTPALPKCPGCPVGNVCKARRQGCERDIPEARLRQPVEEVVLAMLLLEREGHILLSNTPALDFVPGKWGLPAVQVESSGSAEKAACDLARRITGGFVALENPFTIRHAITHRRIVARVFRSDGSEIDGKGAEGREYQWAERTVALRHITSSLFRKAIRHRQ